MAVFNAEDYLKKSLESLIRQSYSNLQIICVDDCSTDHSLSILHQYKEKDNRIEVIHLEKNCGLAHARNVALKHADGDFICMLDADDWYSDNAMEEAIQVFHDHPSTDCVLFHCSEVFQKDKAYDIHPDKYEKFDVLSGHDACIKSLTWQIHGIYIVRGDLHRQYPYDETTRMNSDENTTRVHFYYSREVRYSKGIYYYLQHESSISHAPTIRIFDIPKANESLLNFLKSVDFEEQVIRFFTGVCWMRIVDTYYRYYRAKEHFTPEEAEYGRKEIFEAWKNINLRDIDLKNRIKLGYIPFKFKPYPLGFFLFRMEENLYFGLKKLFNKL